MTAVVVIIYMAPSRRMPAIRWLLILTVSFCVVSFCTLGVYISKELETQILFSRMRFLTLGWMPPSWLFFLSTVYGRWTWLQKKWVTVIILIPGFVSTTLTLIYPFHDYIVQDFSPLIINSFSVLQYKTGPWFQVHYLWAMMLVGLSLILGIYTFLKEKGLRRRQVVILTICSMLAAGIDIYCVLTSSPLRWLMLASGTFFFSQIGIVFAALKFRLLNVVPLAMARVFQEFPDPVFVTDEQKKIRLINKAAMKFFGINKEVVGKSFSDVLSNVDLVSGEISLHNQEGEKHFFDLNIEKIETDAEEITGQVIFFRQITLQKGIEKRLNENLEFKARLLALIAHDLTGHIENQAMLSLSLQDEVEGSVFEERMNLLATSTLASQGVVDNVMSWVKSQGTQFGPVKKDFEWNTLIKDCIESVSTSSKLKKIEIVFESNKWPLLGSGDSDMMNSVLRNIILNSIRATSEGKKILIKLNSMPDSVEIVILDEGSGMSSNQLRLIESTPEDFSFQLKMRSEGQGYGIGLAIVRHFIALHKGRFFIESQLNIGTKVSFQIPLS